MKLWKFISAALVALIFSAITSHAAVDRVCNYTVGSTTTATGFANCTEEIADLSTKAFAFATVTGTDVIVGTSSPAVTSLTNNQVVVFKAVGTTTTAPTFQLDGTAAASIYLADGTTALGAGDLVNGVRYVLTYQSSPARWILLGSPGSGTASIGLPYLTVGNTAALTSERAITADGTTITGTDGGANSSYTLSVTTNGIGNSQIRQGSATSVIGRSANSTGNVADIAASADGQFLMRSSSALTFAVPTATQITNTAAGNISSTTAQAAINELDTEKLALAGGTMTGKLTTVASASGGAGFNIPSGSAPSSPTIGDIWQETNRIKYRTSVPSTVTLVGEDTTQTLSSKSISLTSNTVTGTLAEFNTAISDADIQPLDADLTALAGNSTAGLWAATGAGTGAARTLSAPAAGLTITNPAGTAGNPTFALANDLAAYEGLSANGIVARTGTDAAAARTITGTANEITLTNGDGVAGNPTVSLPSALTFTGKTVTGGTFSGPAITTPGAGITFAGSTSGTTTLAASATAGATALTLPAATDTLVGKATTDILTNKTISGASNTLTNIGNSSLINSATTVNSQTCTLGSSCTVTVPVATGITGLGTGVATALATPSSANLRSAVTDEEGTGGLMFGITATMSDDIACTGGHFLKRNAGDTAWECTAIPGGGDMLSTNNLSDVANAATARTNLGVAIGANVQAYDADLTTWAGLTPSANAQSLVTAADYAAMRALLDLEGGTDFYSIAAADSAFIAPAEIDTSAEWRGILTDDVGTGGAMFGLAPTMSDDLSCTASQVVRRNAGDTAFECATVSGTGDLVAANNLSDVASAATAFGNIKQAASETATGVVELATTTEAETGTDTTRAVTPAGVAAAIAAAPGGGTKLLAIGSLTGTGSDDVVLGDTYDSLFIKAYCGDLTGIWGLNVSISDDGSTFGTAISLTGESGTAYKLVQASATITGTGASATNKTVSPQTLNSSDIDAAATSTLYTTTGTETSETGITHTIRLAGSAYGITCTWEVWGTQ